MSVIEAILGSDKKKPEFYELLGCDRRSTTEQITAEYKAKVRSVHPDKQMSENLKDSNEKFAKLQEAYSTLTDESKRRVYDSWLDSPIPGNFEEFSRNSKVVQMSTHWAVPKQQPMIDLGLKEEKKMEEKNDKWKDGRRYQSDIASKFRNYQRNASEIDVVEMKVEKSFYPELLKVVCMNGYSFDGLIVAALLFICTCSYLKRVPRISSWLLSEKKGFFGVFYKAAVIGVRLHSVIGLFCFASAFYVLLIR